MKYFLLLVTSLCFVHADAFTSIQKHKAFTFSQQVKPLSVPSVLLRRQQPPAILSFLDDSAFTQKKYNDLMHRSRIFKTAGIPLTAVGGAIFLTGGGILYYASFRSDEAAEHDPTDYTSIGLGILAASAVFLVPGIVLTVKGVGYKKRAQRIKKTLGFAPDIMMNYASGSAYGGKLVLNF